MWEWTNTCCTSFNPRAREGRDIEPSTANAAAIGFQPARPRGARQSNGDTALVAEGFNPRAREGRDAAAEATARAVLVSTRAPARGATVTICMIVHIRYKLCIYQGAFSFDLFKNVAFNPLFCANPMNETPSLEVRAASNA